MIPRFGTKRNFDNPTYGPRVGMIARLMGQPFMPWQQYMADVLGEVDPQTGFLVYREGYLGAMRQVGKTTFVIAKKAHSALDTKEPVSIAFAAQNGSAAVSKMIAHAKMLRRTPLGRLLAAGTPSTNNNNPHMLWGNGSIEIPLTERKDSGHGENYVLGAITEAMSQRDDRYLQAIQPAMNVHPNAQLFVESTHGDASSIYWNEQVDELTERYEADPAELTASRIAYFNFSFGPDEDAFAESTWRRRIPSLGHTLRVEEVEHAARNATTPKKIRAFKRGFGNIADLGAGDSSLFNEEIWAATETEDIIIGLRALTFDVTPDRSWSSLSWAGMTAGGEMLAELIAHDRSTHWLVTAAGEIFDRNPKMARRIYCVPGGEAVTLEKAFTRAGIDLIILGRADYAGAAGEYFSGCGDGESHDEDEDEDDEPAPRILHRAARDQLPLHIAVGGAAWTKDKAPVWDHRRATTVISPLVACSIAPWAYHLELERDYDPIAAIRYANRLDERTGT